MSHATSTLQNARRRRFTVDEYHRMDSAGIFDPDERLELLEGVIYTKHLGEPRSFTADEFERIADADIIRDDERVELIEGEILEMSRIGSPHAACVRRLNRAFVRGVGDRAIVVVQNPIRLAPNHEPEPDLALAIPRDDFYQAGHPTPADLYLVVEVMDTSAAYDRTVKLPLYARYGVPEVWLVDLNRGLVEIHRDLVGGIYTTQQIHPPGGMISPAAFLDILLAVEAILSRADS